MVAQLKLTYAVELAPLIDLTRLIDFLILNGQMLPILTLIPIYIDGNRKICSEIIRRKIQVSKYGVLVS